MESTGGRDDGKKSNAGVRGGLVEVVWKEYEADRFGALSKGGGGGIVDVRGDDED